MKPNISYQITLYIWKCIVLNILFTKQQIPMFQRQKQPRQVHPMWWESYSQSPNYKGRQNPKVYKCIHKCRKINHSNTQSITFLIKNHTATVSLFNSTPFQSKPYYASIASDSSTIKTPNNNTIILWMYQFLLEFLSKITLLISPIHYLITTYLIHKQYLP